MEGKFARGQKKMVPTVKSPKKEQYDGLHANWYYEIVSWNPTNLKAIDSEGTKVGPYSQQKLYLEEP